MADREPNGAVSSEQVTRKSAHPEGGRTPFRTKLRNAAAGILFLIPGMQATTAAVSAHPLEGPDGDTVMYQPGMDTTTTPPGVLKVDIQTDSLTQSNQDPSTSVPKGEESSAPTPDPASMPASPSPERSNQSATETYKFKDGADYVQHLFILSNSRVSSVMPGGTPETNISMMDVTGPGKSIGGGEKEFTLKEGNGSRIVTKDNVAIMQAFTPLKGQEPSLETIKKDYGEPEYMKKGVSDPNMNLGPAGAFAFWESPYGGGFAAMVDTSSDTVKEIIVVNDSKNNLNYSYTKFLGEWGKLYLAPNGKKP